MNSKNVENKFSRHDWSALIIITALGLAGATLGGFLAHIGVVPKIIEMTIIMTPSVHTLEMPSWFLGIMIFLFTDLSFAVLSDH